MRPEDDAAVAGRLSPLGVAEGGPPIAAVRARMRSRRRARRAVGAVGALAVIAATVLVWLQPPGSRDRGVGASGGVRVSVVAEGPRGARPLGDGSFVAPDERVVFFLSSSSPGFATISEVGSGGSRAVYPEVGAWRVGAGEFVPGGGSPLAWRPDRPDEALGYRVVVCADRPAAPGEVPEGCATDEVALRWSR
jgi:hypothetical protein